MEQITYEEFKRCIYQNQEKDLYIHIESSIRTMLMIDKCILYIKNDDSNLKLNFDKQTQNSYFKRKYGLHNIT